MGVGANVRETSKGGEGGGGTSNQVTPPCRVGGGGGGTYAPFHKHHSPAAFFCRLEPPNTLFH